MTTINQNITLCLKSEEHSFVFKVILSRLEQINFKSYFLRTNPTWGQLRSEESIPLELKRPCRLGSIFQGRLPSLHRISQLRRPIGMKLCRIIDIWLSFITQVQKFGGPSLKHFGAQNGVRSTGQQTNWATHFGQLGDSAPKYHCDIDHCKQHRTYKEIIHFYRAMHFNAKRSLAIASRLSVCPSVRLSVTLVDFDHTGWNSLKIISLLLSEMCSLSAVPNIMDLAQGEHQEILVQIDPPLLFERRRHQVANCGRMVTDSATVTMDSLQETTIALSNGAIANPLRPPLTPMQGFHMPPRYSNDHISATADQIHFMFGSRVGFQGRRIECRYFWLHQIQDGGRPPTRKNSIANCGRTVTDIATVTMESLQ